MTQKTYSKDLIIFNILYGFKNNFFRTLFLFLLNYVELFP